MSPKCLFLSLKFSKTYIQSCAQTSDIFLKKESVEMHLYFIVLIWVYLVAIEQVYKDQSELSRHTEWQRGHLDFSVQGQHLTTT